MATKENGSYGVSVDVGTMNFVSARKVGPKIEIFRVRDAFIDLPTEYRKMLKLSDTGFVEIDGHLLIVGDDAIDTANLLNREARRPMSAGLLNAGEIDSQRVIGLILQKILGEPRKEKEKCFYSVPAPAIDVENSNITYHQMVLKRMIDELGYEAESSNEAHAIIFSECAKEKFSGLGISFGSGMTNVCLSYNAMPALEFSLSRGGDFIDRMAAQSIGSTSAKMCALKESGLDLNQPKSREQEAIKIFIENVIDYSLKGIIDHFHKVKSEILVPKPIPIVVSGGTSLATGFLDRFKVRFEALRSKFPIQISEIRAAKDPMTAVATGLLVLAQSAD